MRSDAFKVCLCPCPSLLLPLPLPLTLTLVLTLTLALTMSLPLPVKMAGDLKEAAASLERAVELEAHAPSREAMAQEVMVLDHLAATAPAAAPAAAAPTAAPAAAAPATAATAAAVAAVAATVPGDSSGAAPALPTDHPDHLSEVATKVAYGVLAAGSLAEAAAACSLRAYALAQGHKVPLREHVWPRVRGAQP